MRSPPGANICARARSPSPAGPERMADGTRLCATVKITNKRGLHARASAKIVEASARFQSQITVTMDGQSVDGRSIMGLMMLAANNESKEEDNTKGPDAGEALKAILA